MKPNESERKKVTFTESTPQEAEKEKRIADLIDNANSLCEEDIDKMIAKVEAESQFRESKGTLAIIIAVLSVAMSVFHFWLAGFSPVTGSKARILHLAFALCLTFLVYPLSKKRDRFTLYDALLAVMGAVVNLYLFFNIDRIAINYGRSYHRAGDSGCAAGYRSCLVRHCGACLAVCLFGSLATVVYDAPGLLRFQAD